MQVLIVDTGLGKCNHIIAYMQALKDQGKEVVIVSELTPEIMQKRLEATIPVPPIVPIAEAGEAKLFVHQSPLESLQSNHKRYKKRNR